MKFPVRMVGKHGAMHAYSTSEVAHLQSLGWSVEVPDPPVVPVINGADVPMERPAALVELDAIDEAIAATEPPKRKPGRPRKVQ